MPWWWAVPAAASLASAALSKGKKKPNPMDYFGEDEKLAGQLRGYISRLMPEAMTDNSARYEADMNRDTADTFARKQAAWNESAASRGIRRSSWDAEAGAELARGEAGARGENFARSRSLATGEQGQRLGYISRLIDNVQGLGRGREMAYGSALDEYNQDEASRLGVMGQLGGAAVNSVFGGMIGGDWKSALLSGLNPSYLDYLLGKQPGARASEYGGIPEASL